MNFSVPSNFFEFEISKIHKTIKISKVKSPITKNIVEIGKCIILNNAPMTVIIMDNVKLKGKNFLKSIFV
jgi:hypothetical protein